MITGAEGVPACHLSGPLAAVLRTVDEHGVALSLAISRILRREKGLGPTGRRGLALRAREMMTHRRRIDFALRKLPRLPLRLRYEIKFATLDFLLGRLSRAEVQELFPKVSWGMVAAWQEQLDAIDDPVRRLAFRHSLPDWAAAELIRHHGEEEATRIAASLGESAPRSLRVNELKTDRESLLAALQNEGFEGRLSKLSDQGILLAPYADVLQTDALQTGLFEIQDEASQLGALAVAPPPKGLVVDACAGSGGKTLALASLMKGKGSILALDISERKLDTLRRRARRAEAHTVQALVVEAEQWSDEVEARMRKADRIVLDVPCSGLGAFRRQPELRWRVAASDLPDLEQVQADLARRAAALLAPGARLVYSTCSLRPEENERQIEALLAADPKLELVRLAEIWGKEKALPVSDPTGSYLSLRPDVHGCDGFFAAILRRR